MFPSFGSSDDESWSQLVQQGGNQLEEWNLHRLARDLYRNDLARDSALLSLRGENFRDATIGRFILNQLVSAETHEIPISSMNGLHAELPIVNFWTPSSGFSTWTRRSRGGRLQEVV